MCELEISADLKELVEVALDVPLAAGVHPFELALEQRNVGAHLKEGREWDVHLTSAHLFEEQLC